MFREGFSIGRVFILILMGIETTSFAASLDGQAGLSSQHFANTESATGRVDFELRWASDHYAEPALPAGELHLKSFWEAGADGDRSIDFMPAVIRIERIGRTPLAQPDFGHIWIGRAHPFSESHQGESVDFRSALGARWSQNQSNPLDPDVVGWVGVGATSTLGEIAGAPVRFTMAYSPLFLPSFGPRVDYSENQVATGSRFGRRPPASVQFEDAGSVPMRYRIDTGDIKDILLQHQGFISAGLGDSRLQTDLMAWSAPSPDPTTDADGKLRVTSEDANVLVIAKPKFDRQNYLGARIKSEDAFLKPEFQVAHELQKQNLTVSSSIQPISHRLGQVTVGFLHTIAFAEPAPVDPSTPAIESPQYASYLGWAEWKAKFFREKFMPGLRFEKHFQVNKEDFYLNARAGYAIEKNWLVQARLGLIAGQDKSYFGVWRPLDSASLGVSYVF